MKNRKILRKKIDIRFKDVDLLGHVNNAVFITYFEQGRLCFIFEEFNNKSSYVCDFILAQIECNYLKPLKLGNLVLVEITVGQIGKKSFSFEYKIINAKDYNVVYATGQSIQVWFDYKRNHSIILPEDIKKKLQKYCKQ